ncbi:Ig-like domain-containing protein [Neobacillus dielmonensis]|uniref:Ig-like domain-containing protein n=1 Tax=Neobacillus dielmonensis TaxID=1347369 RepID=UPI000693E5AB|nr:Ig-like domain-containing protein [Neobacillus dielmonensis]
MNIGKNGILPFIFMLGILFTCCLSVPSSTYAQGPLNVPLISQLPELKNGCEVTSLAMLFRYKGILVDKMTLANQVKKDPTPYRNVGGTIYWGNPNTGFVGDITGRSIGYSAYHGPVYQLASQYTNMIDLTGNSFDAILSQLDRGKPVWVITTSTFDTVPSSQWQTIQTPIGPLTMTYHEHSVVLTGYDNNYVYFNDPLANIKNRKVSRSAFLRGWEQFGRQAMTYSSSIGMLDSPAPGIRINTNYNLSGWFLDETGVSKVEVLVDGRVVGQAVYGDSRPDVQNAYPQYQNGNAGFHYLLNISTLAGGNHTVAIRETGKNGYVTTLPERTFSISNTHGVLDSPAEHISIKGVHNVSGWFLDESGVSKVEVLLDGALAGQAVYGDARPDVKKAYPEYNNGNAGFHYALDTSQYNDGNHTITVKETSATGREITLPVKNITIANVKGYLDNLFSGNSLKGNYTISGWFLDESGTSKVEVLVDGEVAGQAVYGDSRPDVKTAFPEYDNGSAGFHYALDTTKYSDGSHEITLRETGTNGRVTTLPSVPVSFSNVKGYLDQPASNTTLKGKNTISGWYLDIGEVSKIEVLVDGQVAGTADYGDEREDVNRAYPEFTNAHSGFHYLLDTTRFNNGTHTITVKETAINGRTTTLPDIKVSFSNEVKGYLDAPAVGSNAKGVTNVSGWFLDGSGVSKIEIVVDGQVAGQAVYGDQRLDVKHAFPDYKNANGGFHYDLDTTGWNDGIHSIVIRENGGNGRVTTLPAVTITISNVKGYLDAPASGINMNGTSQVSGWYLDVAGVSKIEVLVDGQAAGQAIYGDGRPDVKAAFPEFKNANAGFHYLIDTTKYTDGSHTISIKETGENGSVTTLAPATVIFSNGK